jgi:hypothetical protein
MIDKDLDNKLVNVFKDCPYGGERDNCSFSKMQAMEITEKLDYLSNMDDDEKIIKWQKHLECLMNSLAR